MTATVELDVHKLRPNQLMGLHMEWVGGTNKETGEDAPSLLTGAGLGNGGLWFSVPGGPILSINVMDLYYKLNDLVNEAPESIDELPERDKT